MRDNQKIRTARFFNSMQQLGISYQDADKLRLIQRTLHRWAELECGNSDSYSSTTIERDDDTGKPFMTQFIHPNRNAPKGWTNRFPVRDREKGALKRLGAIMAKYPDLVPYHQTDPRGCALWLVPKTSLNGHDINSVYTRGVAVCID